MQRGEAHGEEVRPLIDVAVGRWDEVHGARGPDLRRALADGATFLHAAERLAPSLAAEVEGIARGANADRRRIWALNLLDESWWMRRELEGTRRQDADAGAGCSSFGIAASSSQHPLLAQNMDLPSWLEGLGVLLDIGSDDGPRALVPSYAGCIGTNALNEHGVGICVNTLSQLPTDRSGVPVSIVIRLLAHCSSVGEARSLVRALPHASGQNYLIGDPEAIVDQECGAGTIEDQEVLDGRLAHTNHPLGEDAPEEGGVVAGSLDRLRALNGALGQMAMVEVEDAQRVLRSPPVCREIDGDGAFTFSSVVMELAPVPRLHLADGPPNRSPYRTYRFDRDGTGAPGV